MCVLRQLSCPFGRWSVEVLFFMHNLLDVKKAVGAFLAAFLFHKT